ncbi:unnamed protein product [Acanthoscelides obtectus]|uniref:DUF7869 domain-containing protein n=1 Tax=Acanthoscelides obtectus TaxID=200917 RepID=A0A9P0KFT7_ACAOB|nr:unnamed protein product [Acanthoscelides obtectus]CAK1654478.1 hypothetical protein AOBTE_LOCUS18628 [Acanthoscelides obtectus]
MYKLYCEQHPGKSVSFTIYRNLTMNLRFKRPKIDTCTKCDTLNAKLKYTISNKENEKKQIEELLEEHQNEAENAYKSKSLDKEKYKLNEKCVTYAFDLQQVLPTPYLTSNKMFYLRQLPTYNLTIHNCSDGKSSHFMWPESTGARGANEISSCIYRFIKSIPERTDHLIFYSDTCGEQNKNFIVMNMFQYVVHTHATVNRIDHKFLVPGHTHLECDIDHSVIERAKKKTSISIHVPRDWYQLVRTANKKDKFSVFPMEIDHFFGFFGIIHKRTSPEKKNQNKRYSLVKVH